MTKPPLAEQPDALDRAVKLMKEFQRTDHSMQITTALILLTVAKHQHREGGLLKSS